MKRRTFLQGCCATAIAASAPRFGVAAGAGNAGSTLVMIFLRGGMDGLNFLPPIAGADRGYYEQARPDIQIPLDGVQRALPVNGRFGLHPAASGLKALYDDGFVALIQATGLPANAASRSHFQAMNYIELGTPGDVTSTSGWLTRHLTTLPGAGRQKLPAAAIASQPPESLLGSLNTLTLNDSGSFVPSSGRWRDSHLDALAAMYNGSGSLDLAVREALKAVATVDSLNFEQPPGGGAVYPDDNFGDQLKLIGQMIKQNVGLRVATLDLGGWDTHNGQGDNGEGYFADRIELLAEGLYALFSDVEAAGRRDQLTIAVQSEFGRRVRQNADRGTDHGSGSVMTVVSGVINGGLYGRFPGLANDQLFDRADLRVTTDYRQVLAEVAKNRLGNPNTEQLFPGFQLGKPLGLFPEPALFQGGFE